MTNRFIPASFARVVVVASFVVVGACRCGPLLPDPPKECTPDGAGCLDDEICVDFQCVPRPKCETSDDCQSPAFQCVLPAQICALREGFGEECSEPNAPCNPPLFCALGICRDREETRGCALDTDCPTGQKCDAVHFFCIPDADCRLSDDFPELACDASETCDSLSGRCTLSCGANPACHVDTDCPIQGERCDGSCRCVDCINDDDCGPGLLCDERAGRCQSENLCFTDDDCTPPLICDPGTALCQVAPPACSSDFDCALGQKCDIASGRCGIQGEACIGDRFEDADTPAFAEEIEVTLGENTPITGLTLCENDDDVYSVLLAAGDLLVVTVLDTEPRARATIWLLDSSGERSLDFAETPPRGNGTIAYVAEQDETVFLRLTALIDHTDYTLQLTRDTGAQCLNDPGFEPNDDALTANSLEGVPDGTILARAICPDDIDVYLATVSSGEALEATLTSQNVETDVDLAFIDAQGLLIAQNGTTENPETLRHRFPQSADVYVRVKGFGTDIGNYTLKVNHLPPFVCVDDAAEPTDNDALTAPALALNAGIALEDRTMCQQDVDLIQAPLEDFERIVVSTIYDDADVELAVDILDATGENVLATSPPGTGGAAVSYDAVGNETVVVRIRGIGGSIGPYQLQVDKENQLDCAPDALEPDNTVGAAVALPAQGQLLSICENDQDFFVVNGHEGKKIVADASFRQAEADIDLILIGIDGVQLLATADGTGDGEHLEFVLPLDGAYTLRVFSLTSGAKARYSLSVTETTP